jgi:hypothetical protein
MRDLRVVVVRGQAGGSIIPREYGFDVWQRTVPGASPLEAVRGVFFEDLDGALTSRGSEFADAIRAQYLRTPGYAGPTVPAQQ